MIDFYVSKTPNGMKVALFFAETGVKHREIPIRLSKGDQHAPEFLAISPNAKIPVVVDYAPADGAASITIFESGAILLYLAEKYGVLMPSPGRERLEVLQWLFWQVAGLGPFGGQAGHFNVHARERVPYAIGRYVGEVARLYGVLDRRLSGRSFIVGDYSIADIAAYPWITPHRGLGQDLNDFPNLKRWYDRITARPAVQRAYAGVEDAYAAPLSTGAYKTLFQQGARR